MNAHFYRPSEINWQDAFEPRRYTATRPLANPFVFAALEDPIMKLIRETRGYAMALYSAPEDAYLILGPGATYDGTVSLPAGSWILGVSVSSAQAEGVLLQVTLPDGETLFSRPLKSQDLAGAIPFRLSTPYGIPDGGTVKMRLINQSPLANSSQLVLWVVQPE